MLLQPMSIDGWRCSAVWNPPRIISCRQDNEDNQELVTMSYRSCMTLLPKTVKPLDKYSGMLI